MQKLVTKPDGIWLRQAATQHQVKSLLAKLVAVRTGASRFSHTLMVSKVGEDKTEVQLSSGGFQKALGSEFAFISNMVGHHDWLQTCTGQCGCASSRTQSSAFTAISGQDLYN